LRNEVSYLGYNLMYEGILPDEPKLNSIKEFPLLTITKKLKGFLSLTGYYRFFI
jgi:hypothetical protein